MKVTASEKQFLCAPAAALFQQCHAATLLQLPGGQLIAAFFAGEREGAGDTAIWLAQQKNSQWQSARRINAEAGLAHWNPVLHWRNTDNPAALLFYKVGANVHEWLTRLSISVSDGANWSAPQALVAQDKTPRGPVKNKLITLSNGVWLAPSSVEDEQHWDAFVDYSSDQGASWQRIDVPFMHHNPAEKTLAKANSSAWDGLQNNALWECDPARVFAWDGIIQPTLWESTPGNVHMLLRSTRGFIYRSDSTNFGRTWCAAYATKLPNNNSGIDLLRLPSGQLLLVHNPVGGNWAKRYPLILSGSNDNGQSWFELTCLESEEGEFSYPAIIADQDNANIVHISYTWNRQNIVYQRMRLNMN